MKYRSILVLAGVSAALLLAYPKWQSAPLRFDRGVYKPEGRAEEIAHVMESALAEGKVIEITGGAIYRVSGNDRRLLGETWCIPCRRLDRYTEQNSCAGVAKIPVKPKYRNDDMHYEGFEEADVDKALRELGVDVKTDYGIPLLVDSEGIFYRGFDPSEQTTEDINGKDIRIEEIIKF